MSLTESLLAGYDSRGIAECGSNYLAWLAGMQIRLRNWQRPTSATVRGNTVNVKSPLMNISFRFNSGVSNPVISLN